jgi:hypothetical protein
MAMRRTAAAVRVLRRVDQPEGECWLWHGMKNGDGYGLVRRGGLDEGHSITHRVVYEALVGLIPVGMELDHLCRERSCVNPDHLEPVLHRVNVQRGALQKIPLDRYGYIRESSKSAAELALEFGVTKTRIFQIRRGE